jgi:hypothetical protein
MMHQKRRYDDAVTGLELIAIIIGVLVIVYGVQTILTQEAIPGSQHQGILQNYVSVSGNAMRKVGSVKVFSAVNGTPFGFIVEYPHPDPARLGAAEMTVALFIGNMGGIDFGKVNVTWATNGVTEKIPRKDSRPLVCPGWTIAGKSDMLPMETANGDNILDPNEQFEIFVCPTNTTAPYQQFMITINPDGSILPPVAIETTPPMVRPVITLS